MAVIENDPKQLLMVDDDGDVVRLSHRSDGLVSVLSPLPTLLDKEECQALAAWLLAIDARERYEVRQIPGLNVWTVWDSVDDESPEGGSNGSEDHKDVFSQRSDAEALAAKLNAGLQDRPVDHPMPTTADVVSDQISDGQ